MARGGRARKGGVRTSKPTNLADRLRYVREKVAGEEKIQSFYDRVMEGVEDPPVRYSAARNYEITGKDNKPHREAPAAYLECVLRALPEVRAEWLLMGEGEPTRARQLVADAQRAAASRAGVPKEAPPDGVWSDEWWDAVDKAVTAEFPLFANLLPQEQNLIRHDLLAVALHPAGGEGLEAGDLFGLYLERAAAVGRILNAPLREIPAMLEGVTGWQLREYIHQAVRAVRQLLFRPGVADGASVNVYEDDEGRLRLTFEVPGLGEFVAD